MVWSAWETAWAEGIAVARAYATVHGHFLPDALVDCVVAGFVWLEGDLMGIALQDRKQGPFPVSCYGHT